MFECYGLLFRQDPAVFWETETKLKLSIHFQSLLHFGRMKNADRQEHQPHPTWQPKPSPTTMQPTFQNDKIVIVEIMESKDSTIHFNDSLSSYPLTLTIIISFRFSIVFIQPHQRMEILLFLRAILLKSTPLPISHRYK